MKTVFSGNEIAHAWVHNLAPYGRSAAAMRFDGGKFYSYATQIAGRCEVGGEAVYVVNRTQYSVTTSGHLSHVLSAIPHGVRKFTVRGVGRGYSFGETREDLGRAVVRSLLAESAESFATWGSSKRLQKATRAAAAQAALSSYNEAKEAAAFFRVKFGAERGLLAKLQAAATGGDEVLAAHRERVAAKEAREAARREVAARESLEKWLSGESSEIGGICSLPSAYMRIAADGETVETSKGVRVSLREVRAALRFVNSKRECGWHRNGEKFPVGDYQLDAVNESGVVAGCHRFAWGELERFGAVVESAKSI